MRKTVAIAFLAILISSASTAVVGVPNASEGEMTITGSGSSASGTTAAGPNGTLYTSKVSMTGRNPNFTENSVSLVNRTSDSISFEGSIRAGTPCHILDHGVEETDSGDLVLNVKTLKDSPDTANRSGCVQQAVMIEYEGSAEKSEGFKLEIQHDGQKIETFRAEQAGGSKDETVGRKKGIEGLFAGINGFLSNLF